jgi:hypothetical protein
VDVLREGIFETDARTCNAFRCGRIARTRRSLCGRFRGQPKRRDDLVPCQSGRHRFLHELARDNTFFPSVHHPLLQLQRSVVPRLRDIVP